jgi:hypothetical protein
MINSIAISVGDLFLNILSITTEMFYPFVSIRTYRICEITRLDAINITLGVSKLYTKGNFLMFILLSALKLKKNVISKVSRTMDPKYLKQCSKYVPT